MGMRVRDAVGRTSPDVEAVRDSEFRWILPARQPMRVPGVVFASG